MIRAACRAAAWRALFTACCIAAFTGAFLLVSALQPCTSLVCR